TRISTTHKQQASSFQIIANVAYLQYPELRTAWAFGKAMSVLQRGKSKADFTAELLQGRQLKRVKSEGAASELSHPPESVQSVPLEEQASEAESLPVSQGEQGDADSQNGQSSDDADEAQMDRVPAFQPALNPDSPPYRQGSGSFFETGLQQIGNWVREALDRLGDGERADLAFMLSKDSNAARHVATACSGCDGAIPIAKMLLQTVSETLGGECSMEHVFSCEQDSRKQMFLLKMFRNTWNDADMRALFEDTEVLRQGPGAQAHDQVSGSSATVPMCTDLFMGFPCQDISKLNRNAAENADVIRNRGLRTGRVFDDVVAYVQQTLNVQASDVEGLDLPENSLTDPDSFRGLVLENVPGLLEGPRGVNPATGDPWCSNWDYCNEKLQRAGLFSAPFLLEPWLFGVPVVRKRVYIICLPKKMASEAGVTEEAAREFACKVMQKLCCSGAPGTMRCLDDFLLQEDSDFVKEELDRARQLEAKRRESELRAAASSKKGKQLKWPEQHAAALAARGLDWWEHSRPPPEVLTRFPGLLALTERQFDLCRVQGISFPDTRHSAVQLSQSLRGHRRILPNRSDIVLPLGELLLTHRCRLATGAESLSLQGIHFGRQQHRLMDVEPDLLQSLAGNSFHGYVFAAVLLTKLVLEAHLVAEKAVLTNRRLSSKRPGRKSTLDDLFSFPSNENMQTADGDDDVALASASKNEPGMENVDNSFLVAICQMTDAVLLRFHAISGRVCWAQSAKRSALGVSAQTAGSDPLSVAGPDSDVWGHASFKGCKFCRRSRNFPNPLLALFPNKPCLGFRSERHSECLTCTCVNRREGNIESATDKNAHAKKLAEDRKSYDRHMELVEAHEKQALEAGAKKRKIGSHVSEGDLRDTQVTVNSTAGLELRTCLGILWPQEIYERKHGVKLQDKDLTCINQAGQVLKGVLRPKSDGMEQGCTEIFDVRQSFAAKAVTEADSATAISEKEVDVAWARAHGRHSLGVTTPEDAEGNMGPPSLSMKQGVKRPAPDDFDDLMAFDSDFFSVSGGGKNTELPSPQGASKATREVQATDRILLECQQAVHNIQEGMSVKTKHITSLGEKVKSRLSPALVALYTIGYDPSSDAAPTEGFLALEKLRTYEQVMLKIEPFVKGLNNEDTRGQEVWAAAKAATCKDFTPPKNLAELVLQREVDRAAKAKDFDTIKSLLQCSSVAEGSTEHNFDTALIEDGEKRVAFREREITRLAAELMRQDNQVDAVADLIKSVVESSLLPEDSQIMQEFRQVIPLFKPLDLDTPVDHLQFLITKFRTERSLKLHKVLNFFTTGLKILDGAAAGLASRSKDTDLKRRLDDLRRKAALLPVPSAIECEDYKTLRGKAEHFQCIFETLTEIKTSGSVDFIRRETDALKDVEDKMEAFAKYSLDVMKLKGETDVERALKEFCDTCDESDVTSGGVADFQGACATSIEDLDSFGLDFWEGLVGKEDAQSKFFGDVEKFSNLLKILSSSLPKLLVDQVDDWEELSALVELVAVPKPIVTKWAGWAAAQPKLETKLTMLFEKTVVAAFQPLVKATPTAANVLKFLVSREQDTAALDSSSTIMLPEVKQMLLDAEKTSGALMTALASWRCKAFGSIAATLLDEAEAPGLSLWIMACFPKVCGLALQLKDLVHKSSSDDTGLIPEVATFGEALAIAKTKSDEFRSFMQTLELPNEDADGAKVMLAQKISQWADGLLKELVSRVIEQAKQKFSATEEEVQKVLDHDGMKSVDSELERGWGPDVQQKLLEISSSTESKRLHALVKVLDTQSSYGKDLQCVKSIFGDIEPPMIAAEVYAAAKKANVVLACIQALGRPLKEKESRAALARRARLMAFTKEVTLPANLDMLLNKTAGEGSGTSGAVSVSDGRRPASSA
ncbi:unnamed protein product, partial [Symbiodinium necroappetens]